jgi:hypothetical protein
MLAFLPRSVFLLAPVLGTVVAVQQIRRGENFRIIQLEIWGVGGRRWGGGAIVYQVVQIPGPPPHSSSSHRYHQLDGISMVWEPTPYRARR